MDTTGNDIFISYSRKDTTFAQKLDEALRGTGRDPWVDWEDIPLTADWWAEIQAGIEAVDTFVFIISPDSVASKVCNQETDHAAEHNKRIVPIVYRDAENVPEKLAAPNWIFCRESDDFDDAFKTLVDTLPNAVMVDNLPGEPDIDEFGQIQVSNFRRSIVTLILPGLVLFVHGFAFLVILLNLL